ncbi:hypothetical protein [Krasilnikovia sp. M28-CT-15]|uniref:hypothetical protein n=1 Tax=Krasilnikovia sp. M28-CT-15 TaxID=3373540 RepID=UPI00399D0A07
MAVPNSVKVPVPFDFVFPHGCLCLGVEPATDFDRRNQPDDQARDKDTGERVWLATVVDLDPEAGKFGRPKEVKVKVVAPVQPVPPPSAMPGYPPLVEFTDVTISPWSDSQRCKAPEPGKPHKCKARLGWTIRATGISEPRSAAKPKAA